MSYLPAELLPSHKSWLKKLLSLGLTTQTGHVIVMDHTYRLGRGKMCILRPKLTWVQNKQGCKSRWWHRDSCFQTHTPVILVLLTTFLEFFSRTLVHMSMLYLSWSYCPCGQANWETRKPCSFTSFTFLEPLMGEWDFCSPLYPHPGIAAISNTSTPLKAIPVGISPGFSVPDTLLQRDFPASERLFLLTILCKNFLFSLYQRCLGIGTTLIHSMLLSTVLETELLAYSCS